MMTDEQACRERERFSPSNCWVLAFTVCGQPVAVAPVDWEPYFFEVCDCGSRGYVMRAEAEPK